MQLSGLHHVTAITADARANRRFYVDLLGMRLVKKTVNQDDPGAYHLFYADGVGSPGTDVTFFDWPMGRERRGTGSIARIGLRVAGTDALDYWARRLRDAGYDAGDVAEFAGRAVLDLEDPEGQRLRLVDDGGSGEAHPWAGSPVPAAMQVRGLGPVTLSVPRPGPTDLFLREVLGMTRVGDHEAPGGGPVHVYKMGEGGPSAELHLAVDPDLPAARQGAGGVHHLAFRTAGTESLRAWVAHLDGLGVRHSGEVERWYFRSLYFREPAGILFEIATDGPGFAVDEPVDSLGERLSLPPFLEPHRARIEAGLRPLGDGAKEKAR